MKPASTGRIVVLNGASSSGKSSIASALLNTLPDAWFHFPVDAVGAMRAPEQTAALGSGEVADLLRRTRLGYHRAVAGLASAGCDVIMDYPLSEPWRLADLLDVLHPYDVTLVDVYCSPQELERRERARGDRPLGLATSQDVFAHDDRDVTVDSTDHSPQACAETIAQEMPTLGRPKAFDRMRRRLSLATPPGDRPRG